MAKKTATKKVTPKKAAAKPTTPKKTAAKQAEPARKPTPTITADQIGFAAGDTWGYLHGKGWQTLAAVKKGVDHPTDLTMLALGWLAREGKLDFEASGRSVKVTLRG